MDCEDCLALKARCEIIDKQHHERFDKMVEHYLKKLAWPSEDEMLAVIAKDNDCYTAVMNYGNDVPGSCPNDIFLAFYRALRAHMED